LTRTARNANGVAVSAQRRLLPRFALAGVIAAVYGAVTFLVITFGASLRSLMGIGPGHPSEAFRITIDLSTQTASLWRNGKIILATRISSGRPSHPTPTGRYLVTNKYRQWKSTLYPARMPFFLRLSCGDFGLHMGALPGYPASHGCIRLPERSARKLYASVPVGTLVEIR
jgi:hypothetical protein